MFFDAFAKSNFERSCILTDALIELAVQNYFGPGPDCTSWRARQYAIGILQREVCELRYPPSLSPRFPGVSQRAA